MTEAQNNQYSRRSFLNLLGRGIAGIAIASAGVEALISCSPEPKEDLFYKHRDSLEKKIFIYDQGMNSSVLVDETLKTADYIMPHLIDINYNDYTMKKVGTKKGIKKDKKGKFIQEPIYKKIAIPGHIDVNNVPIQKSNLDKLLKEAKAEGVYIVPMISAFDKEAIEGVLHNPEKYAKIIADKIKSLPVQGVSVDFENVKIDSRQSDALTEFMRILRRKLPEPYVISIAVSPRFEGSSGNGFPHHGFYDYKELAKYVDYVNLMCYDFHKGKIGPSPVMPEDMLLKVLRYARDNIPSEKIVPILPFYGYVWAKNKEGKYIGQGTLSSRNMSVYKKKNIIDSKYVNGEHYIETKNRKIFAQDAKTFDQRFDILDEMNISNMGGWRGDHGSDTVYKAINGWKNSIK